MSIELHHGDCLEVMRGMADSSVDSVVTDPPYGIGYASAWQTRLGGGPRKNGASFGEDKFNADWLPDAYRVLKPDTCLYLFTRWDILHRWADALKATGFSVVQRLLWDKCHWKMGDLRYYGSQTEDVLFARKGTPQMRYDKRRGNMLRFSSAWLPEGQYDHPTQKPVQLCKQYVLDSTRAGDVVLDPFMGTGSTGVACAETDRNFIGVEIAAPYFDIAQKRIQEAQNAARQMEFAS